ncbi:putative aldo/ketone reductase family member protein [Phytophthora sojae]|uniref:Aldo/ketone reductase family member protein n=1 Tax=Phytophthora sojae (strain P6497) TaxID=1094619 RepID=G4Z500_PHYSP|nr:putative aldo/ketone reductase family member protein [Phytophthora sojae]EGZ19446.1 putative aldo/ketone reductase family member protein [Phytophthora sojae]|eukprot:XP_009522163.1 putative aldo/ketone reductase family member protein [Phytophthora sojae]
MLRVTKTIERVAGPTERTAVQYARRHGSAASDHHHREFLDPDVGRDIKVSSISHEDIFVTSKLFMGYERALMTTKESNKKLGLGYIELYLLHGPDNSATRAEDWKVLEELLQQGVLKDISVPNFGEAHIDKLLKTAKAYWPLARAQKMEDATLKEVAKEAGATPRPGVGGLQPGQRRHHAVQVDSHGTAEDQLEAASVGLTTAQVAQLAALDEYLITAWDPIKDHAVY